MGRRDEQAKSADASSSLPDERWVCFPHVHRVEGTLADPEQLNDHVREKAQGGEWLQ